MSHMEERKAYLRRQAKAQSEANPNYAATTSHLEWQNDEKSTFKLYLAAKEEMDNNPWIGFNVQLPGSPMPSAKKRRERQINRLLYKLRHDH